MTRKLIAVVSVAAALSLALGSEAMASWDTTKNLCVVAQVTNPCAAKQPCAAQQPCAAKQPCAATNPCATKKMSNPCAPKNPCAIKK